MDTYALEAEVAHRAHDGAAFLDSRDPMWALKIDVGELIMSDTFHCILGQLFMEKFQESLGKSQVESPFSLGVGALDLSPMSAVLYGFDFDFNYHQPISPKDWSFLAECWVEEIKYRLNKGVTLS